MSEGTNESFEYFDVDRVTNFGLEVLAKVGVEKSHAALLLDTLIKAEAWGHSSHGLLRLSWYFERLRNGAVNPKSEFEILVDTGPLLLIDGKDGLGQIITQRATEIAIKRAKTHGICAVSIRNSNHFGTAMYFSRQAAAENCIAILTTNASPSMAPWGGSKKTLGNNPWSIAAPYGEKVVATDMANTVVARGKIYAAKNRNEDIPIDWAMTADGERTTDASKAIDGVILPMGGHKGYAITFMMDVLSGALSGSEVATGVHGPYEASAKSGAGHLLIVIDISKLAPGDQFENKVNKLVHDVKSSPLAKDFNEIFYPGEIENRNEEIFNKEQKIKVFTETENALKSIGNLVGVEL